MSIMSRRSLDVCRFPPSASLLLNCQLIDACSQSLTHSDLAVKLVLQSKPMEQASDEAWALVVAF